LIHINFENSNNEKNFYNYIYSPDVFGTVNTAALVVNEHFVVFADEDQLLLEKLDELDEVCHVFFERDEQTNLVAQALGEVPILELVVLLPLPEDVVEGVALVLGRDRHVVVVEVGGVVGVEGRLFGLEEKEALL